MVGDPEEVYRNQHERLEKLLKVYDGLMEKNPCEQKRLTPEELETRVNNILDYVVDGKNFESALLSVVLPPSKNVKDVETVNLVKEQKYKEAILHPAVVATLLNKIASNPRITFDLRGEMKVTLLALLIKYVNKKMLECAKE